MPTKKFCQIPIHLDAKWYFGTKYNQARSVPKYKSQRRDHYEIGAILASAGKQGHRGKLLDPTKDLTCLQITTVCPKNSSAVTVVQVILLS